MRRVFRLESGIWVLALLILAPLLGLGARPHSLQRDLHLAGSPMQTDSQDENLAAAYALERAAMQQPWRADLWEPAGKRALLGGDFQAAIQHLEHAAAVGELSARGRMRLGQAYLQTGDLKTAIAIWESLRRLEQPPVEVFTFLLQAHRASRDTPGAIADLQALTALNPGDARLRYQLGLLLAASQPQAALAHLAQAAELDAGLKAPSGVLIAAVRTASLSGDDAVVLLESGRALASLGEWDLAAQALQAALDLRPELADGWAFLGEALQHINQKDPRALPALQRAIELDPRSLSANSLLGLYWKRQQNFEKALESLQIAAQYHPQNPALQVDIGNALAMLGNLEGGLQAHQRAVALAPREAAYYRLLAEFCIRHEYQVRQVGLRAAREAVLIDPRAASGLDVMGQVFVLLDDLDSAQRFLLRAIQADPRHAPAHLHLGLVYILHGNQQQAREAWDLAVELAPGSSTAEQAQRLMQNYFP